MCRAYGTSGDLYITDPLLTEWANFCRASGAEPENRAASVFLVFAAEDHPSERCFDVNSVRCAIRSATELQ